MTARKKIVDNLRNQTYIKKGRLMMVNKKFKPTLISITIFVVIIAVIPKLANPLCLHTYCVGYWFEPCQNYDWQCENCWPCELSCLYQAVHIVCWDEYGNEYWLRKCQIWFCHYSPL